MAEKDNNSLAFLEQLEEIIEDRKNQPDEKSYTTHLFNKGIDKILQKVGEEAVEYILEGKNDDKERMKSEGADLIYHFLVSLHARNLSLKDIVLVLKDRHKK